MATTSHRKISRKELRQPDEFVTLVDRVGQFLSVNLFRVIVGAVVAIAIVAAGFGVSFYEQHRSRLAAEDFYQGIRALDHKDYKKAERQFSDLASNHGGSKPAQLAQFYLATVYIDQNQFGKARDALKAYLDRSDLPVFKQMALAQLGVVNENMGDYRAAHEAYLRAAMLDGPRKQAAELGVARTLVRQGQKAEAIAAYQQFLKENPFSQQRDGVVEALANLGVAPAESSVNARTIEAPPITAAPAKRPAAAKAVANPPPHSGAPGSSSQQGGAQKR